MPAISFKQGIADMLVTILLLSVCGGRSCRNTLAYFHVPFDVLADAAKAALSALRARKLISLKPDGPDGPSHWELTALGSAVVASALAPDVGAQGLRKH